jgi:hypothetical protein
MKILSPALLIIVCLSWAAAQTTAFNFQGRLNDGNSPANGRYDLIFKLFDAPSGGNQLGFINNRPDSMVVNGVFTTALDFGTSGFADSGPRFVEISVRPAGSPNAYVVLGPRQQINSVPFAAPGDFDGDGKADISVFRPSDGTWYRINSSDGSFFAYPFGATGDRPTMIAFTY